MSSALVLVVIAGAWAFVLVPMVRHRHDESTELRSVDRFAGSMRVLSRRRNAAATRSRVVMPARPVARPRVRPETRVVGRNRVRSAERALLLWRRRALASSLGGFLLLALVAVVVRGSVGLVLGLVAVVEVLATVGWLRGSAKPAPGVRPAPARPRSAPLAAYTAPVVGVEGVGAVRVEAAWWHTPAAAVVRERPALRPGRRPAARVDVVATAVAGYAVDGEPSWGVKLLDVQPVAMAAGGEQLFDQTRAAG